MNFADTDGFKDFMRVIIEGVAPASLWLWLAWAIHKFSKSPYMKRHEELYKLKMKRDHLKVLAEIANLEQKKGSRDFIDARLSALASIEDPSTKNYG